MNQCQETLRLLEILRKIAYNIQLMKNLIKILVFSLLFLLSLAQPNYQERVVYYSQADNVCRYGQASDSINLIINMDDESTIRRKIDGNTMCFQWSLRYANAISPLNMTELYQGDNKIYFDQVATKKYTLGLLSQLTLKVTARNPAKLNGKDYTCTILGDGSLQHFGTGFSTLPAEIYLRCLSIKAHGNQQKEQANLVSE